MTRAKLRNIINRAHEKLHNGEVQEAHEILHEGVGETDSMTSDPEVQEAVKMFMDAAAGKLPCGHTIGDLIWSQGSITKCGACVQARQRGAPPAFAGVNL